MSADDRRRPSALKLGPSASSSSNSSADSLKPPRTPRFVEATAIHSPIEQPADVGFGYIGKGPEDEHDKVPMTPRSPLKSAMKVPGTPGRRFDNPLSPTFLEEQVLEKHESMTAKEQLRDLKAKTRVRMAKFALRGVNFSCSLIVLTMLSTSLHIFSATKSMEARSSLSAWATTASTWPQKVVLGCSCVSLAICIFVFVGYCRGGHRRAEKVGVYYTLFAVAQFIFSMIMWAIAAGILQISRNTGGNKDVWGWACVNNKRSQIFGQEVDYALVCRLQNWTLICMMIEIVVEVLSIMLYSIVFYRYYSKRKLHKSMDLRDKARSDLYLAQLRSQSAPNTPGFGPKSPAFSQYALSPRFAPPQAFRPLGDLKEEPVPNPFTPGGRNLIEPVSTFSHPPTAPSPGFKLQPPPAKAPSATPKLGSGGFSPISNTSPKLFFPSTPSPPPAPALAPSSSFPPSENIHEHGPVAPGEVQYAAVPIPGAYADAVNHSRNHSG